MIRQALSPLLIGVVSLTAGGSIGAAYAATINCGGGSCIGTTNDDTINGTDGADNIEGRTGADHVYA